MLLVWLAGRADDAPAPTNQDSSSRRRSRGAHRNNSSSGGGGAEAAGSKDPLPRWKRVWLWCQMEGQFEHSQGEVKELLASDAPLPPALQEVIHRRWVRGSHTVCGCCQHTPRSATAAVSPQKRLGTQGSLNSWMLASRARGE